MNGYMELKKLSHLQHRKYKMLRDMGKRVTWIPNTRRIERMEEKKYFLKMAMNF